ncbi:ABC transporter permease [Lysinibacillus sp. 2017]|uniref:ABC transporter permease subunit n=1 Tax=unclassified Lysinibacillus TaxID=2636778 RepID=UPI000D527005|nr:MULTISPECIES: ABC transporter permease subunit [unclassified Lysinibacillus]AWE07601.1 ABC transporter permease [Lysinibacillus sp. 2017]TGN36764.1 ABC transporter permease [Lysinibacillus sp. S2017]
MQYVKNEWIKMWSQKNAWIMLVILIGLLALISGINKYYDTDSSTSEARQEANENRIKNNTEMLKIEDFSEEDKLYFKEENIKAEYRIANDLPSEDAMSFPEHMNFSISFSIVMIGIFTVVIAAGIVSSEFGTGTIKMLLTRPVARWKILLSKLVTSLLYGITLLVASLAFSVVIGMILFGTDSAVMLSVVDGQVIAETMENQYVKTIIYALASIVMTTIFAFMVGSLFGSSTLAVSLSLFILLMGSTATMFIAQYDFAKYIWFANDFSQFAPGSSPIIEGLTLSFSVIVNIVYAILFLVITFWYFMKRDITA